MLRKIIFIVFFLYHLLGFTQVDCALQWQRFSKNVDFRKASGKALTNAINKNSNLITTWRILDEVEEYNLTTNILELKYLDEYLVSSGKTPESIIKEIKNAGGYTKWKGVANAVDDIATLLAKYGNVRKHLGNSRVTQYFEVEKLKNLSEGIGKGNYRSYEDLLKTANSDVLDVMNKMDEFEFAEMMRGLKDLMNNKKLKTFEEAIKDLTKFDGEYGWLKYWNKTPGLKYAMTTILDLRKAGKLVIL
ncbi:hypothetical protein [Tenacibaculum sp. nBUS_03]|uniref:hypothetical protein n=1 Tax=Tenacibaculum sp. nBUS_03 TaxID=3395320 RepID=UPI003EBDF345